MSRPERDHFAVRALLIALALGALLSGLQRHNMRAGKVDIITGTVRDAVLMPGQSLTLRVSHWWRVYVFSIFESPHLAQENSALKAQVQALTAQNKTLRAAEAENNRLRRLLHFQQKSPRPLLAAEVVALKPTLLADTLALDRGSRDGAHPQSVVIDPNGALVGQVLEVSGRSCNVLMLTDSGSSVGAQVAHRGGSQSPVGICQGDRSGRLSLTYLPMEADVRPGDAVTTSGLGGIFPKGLPVGIVEFVTIDRTRAIKTARVRPSADFDHLEEAFLLQ